MSNYINLLKQIGHEQTKEVPLKPLVPEAKLPKSELFILVNSFHGAAAAPRNFRRKFQRFVALAVVGFPAPKERTTASACDRVPHSSLLCPPQRDEWGTRSHALAVVRFPAGGTRNIRFVLTAFDRIRPNALPNRAAKFQI